MTRKTLYRVDLNYYGEMFTFYRYAYTEGNALSLALIDLAGKTCRTLASVQDYIYDGNDRYLVRKESRTYLS